MAFLQVGQALCPSGLWGMVAVMPGSSLSPRALIEIMVAVVLIFIAHRIRPHARSRTVMLAYAFALATAGAVFARGASICGGTEISRVGRGSAQGVLFLAIHFAVGASARQIIACGLAARRKLPRRGSAAIVRKTLAPQAPDLGSAS